MKNALPAACKFSMASLKALALKCWLDGALKLHPRGKNQCASIKKGRNFTKAVNRKFKKLDSFVSFPSFFFFIIIRSRHPCFMIMQTTRQLFLI